MKRAVALLGSAVAILFADALSAQVDRPGREIEGDTLPGAAVRLERGDPVREDPVREDSVREVPVRDVRLLVDRPVDREEYVLGPGDQVTISTTGEANLEWNLTVTPEGMLIVPTVGVVPVRSLSLDRAEEVVERRMLQYYRNIDVTLTLAGVQGFKVFVVGAIEDPGPRLASAATRVSELVPPGRNIVVQRAGGDTLLVDVIRFRQSGDLAFNPTVQTGDVLLVPHVDQTVEVQGRVFYPGTYEYRAGETLAELLRVANGYRDFPSDAHDVVHVTRFVNRQDRELLTFPRAEATGARGRAFVLQPFDAIFVPRVGDFKVQKIATVEGEVRFPGTYPIRPDTTTVIELVEMAGGFTADASPALAELRRLPADEVEGGLEALQQVPPEFLTDDEQRILRVRQTADPTSVVVDFEGLLQRRGSAHDVVLRDGDVLTVPERREGVTVLGAVLQPGIVNFSPRRDIDDYVQLAGGYTDRSDRGDVVVLKGKTETVLERDEVGYLDSGDTIIVPYEEPRDWWELYTRTSTVMTGVMSLILTYIAATR